MAANKRAKYNRVSVFDVVLYAIMILFMACIVLPFLHVISVSLSSAGPVAAGQVGIWPVIVNEAGDSVLGVTLSTYKGVLDDGSFMGAYKITLFNTIVGTVMSLVITAMCAYALSRRAIVGHKLFSLMITITMFFGGGLIPTYLAVSNYGLTNTIWALILPQVLNTFNMIIMRSFFIAYPSEIVESGQIDGLQDAGVFFRLVLPTSKAALATIGLYYAVAYWNSYMPARLYIRDPELYPVQHYLQQIIASVSSEDTQNEATVLVSASVRYACIMIVVTPIMCVYPFIQKYFVKGVMVGSIKG